MRWQIFTVWLENLLIVYLWPHTFGQREDQILYDQTRPDVFERNFKVKVALNDKKWLAHHIFVSFFFLFIFLINTFWELLERKTASLGTTKTLQWKYWTVQAL